MEPSIQTYHVLTNIQKLSREHTVEKIKFVCSFLNTNRVQHELVWLNNCLQKMLAKCASAKPQIN